MNIQRYRGRIVDTKPIETKGEQPELPLQSPKRMALPNQLYPGLWLYTSSLPAEQPYLTDETAASATTPVGPKPGVTAKSKEPKTDVRQETPERITLGHVAKNTGLGVGFAAPAVQFMTIGNTSTQHELSAALTKYNFSQGASDSIASNVIDFAQSHAGKVTCVFFAGSAVTMGAVEAFVPHWTWPRKLKVAAIGGAIAALAALLLIIFGVWGQSNETPDSDKPDDKPGLTSPESNDT